MDDQIKLVYQQIQGGQLDPSAAVEQLKLLASRQAPRASGQLQNQLQAVLLEIVCELLKVDIQEIDIDTELSEYGFDSILITDFANALNKRMKLNLTPAVFFDNPSIRTCTQSLLEQYEEEIAAYYASASPPLIQAGDGRQLLEQVKAVLLEVISKLLKVSAGELDPDTELSEYGFDSIMLTELSNLLNSEYKLELTPAMFFDNPTIHRFAEYLIQEYEEVFVSSNQEIQRTVPPEQQKELSGTRTAPFLPQPTDEHAYAVEPIAIVGISAKFPQAENANEFWNNIIEGKNCITEVPDDRWNWRDYAEQGSDPSAASGLRWGGFIGGVDEFDPLFFKISPREAELMDPQQRQMLSTVWHALEDAGLHPEEFSQHTTGVFIAAGPGEYKDIVTIPASEPMGPVTVVPSSIPNRISYALNLRGPSEYCEAACSSSLVALHHAVQSIRRKECEQAVVGAVNLLLSPMGFVGFETMGNLSTDGNAKSFQFDAEGYARSEGVGALIIKPLHLAVEQGDHIYALIQGTGTAHGGKGISLTAPNPAGMQAAIAQAYESAGIDPSTVSYVEANGVASPLGDSIEINALKCIAPAERETGCCQVSSLKPCIGHGEVVSGMAQLIKAIYALRHRVIPGVPGFTRLHEHISLKGSTLQISAENRAWKAAKDGSGHAVPRRAGVNSYGFGGVNAHAVLEEYIPQPVDAAGSSGVAKPQMVIFSAKNRERLHIVVERMLAFAEMHEDLNIPDFAYTLQTGRQAMECRMAVIITDREELIQKLRMYLHEEHVQSTPDPFLPWFMGEQPEERLAAKKLISGSTEELMIQELMKENNLEKLALHWVQGGNIPWRQLHPAARLRKLSLPVYPFEKKRYWLEPKPSSSVNYRSSVKQVQSPSLTACEPPALLDYLKQEISELLAIPVEELRGDQSLRNLGFNSIQAVKLRHTLETSFAAAVPMVTISGVETIEQMEQNLSDIVDPSQFNGNGLLNAEADYYPQVVMQPEQRFEPFPLSDMQESFLTGRKLRIGKDWVGCHIYLELAADALDIYRLQSAWNRLMAYHDMLRTKIMANGRQQVQEVVPLYVIKTVDLRMKTRAGQDKHISTVREMMSHKVYDTDQWPLFEIRVSVLPDKKYMIHFSIDEFITDAGGLHMLLQQWRQLYDDLTCALPVMQLSFRDYITAARQFEHSPKYHKDLDYWITKLNAMPQGPDLPRTTEPQDKDTYKRTRLQGTLSAEAWNHLKQKAEQWKVSTTVLILALFTEMLRAWSDHRAFSLILTYYNRLPVHPQIHQVLGPFISSTIFVAEDRELPAEAGPDAFAARVRQYQEQVWSDLDHSSASGVRVLRELKSRNKINGSSYLPVVFTSLLNNEFESALQPSFFDQINYMVTQTPQVYLDHQIFERDGCLQYSWDVAEAYFGTNVIRSMFAAYSQMLEMAGAGDGFWKSEYGRPPVSGLQAGNIEQRMDIPELPRGLMLEAGPADRYESFPLTDQQMAYAFGRSQRKGGEENGCQVYQELDVQSLDIARLERAWNKLIARHDMLKAVIKREGRQAVLQEVPEFCIKVSDLRGGHEEAIQKQLSLTKQAMIEHVFALDQWPYFDLRVSIIDNQRSRVHFCIDMLIADGNSIRLLLSQLLRMYEHVENDMESAGMSFRDYVLALQRYRKSETYRISLNYWMQKFTGIPSGPQLPTSLIPKERAAFQHRQLTGVLENWQTLQQKAAHLGVAPGMVLLTAYAEVLAAWGRQLPFTIVVPCWERLPIHPDVMEVVGDFTAMSWIVVKEEDQSFSQKLCAYHAVVQEDLSHMAVSGLNALRRVAMSGAAKPDFPVVFTNLFTSSEITLPPSFKTGDKLSTTPQVYLDNISEERGGQLHICWDVAENVYPEAMVEEMFQGYQRMLKALADEPEYWERHHFGSLIQARPDFYSDIVKDGRVILK
ncbi:beta-ketoacyl synthase N-terminal-like domain-containing protein [Paenibacillus donghaensis]|uniref:Carrier domain-containing protein n=1 Tax=Paenibacillus donghaensis TaxID=414771 RepID=A0A2Z2K4Z9_9BACL|nr:beta-ketoacyl synthase N-terminal-like domain-containing protein [Paenibacillus donghaensis]ASA19514.1 hypothetical protein B9T62_00885 [Paenibacillus donghaensis]